MQSFSLKNIARHLIVLSMVVSLSACAGMHHNADRIALDSKIADPLEPLNRGVLKFNNAVDFVILNPLAKGYNFLPGFVRKGVGNFLSNLRTPLYAANNVLQGDVGSAGVNVARFVVNTTVGVGGLVDVAAKNGLTEQPEDFGQTLAVWGVGNGFYLVLPVLGPSSLRDTAGTFADAYADPVRIITFSEGEEWIYYTRGVVEGVHNRAGMINVLEDLKTNSLDYYSALKSIYEQRRAALIRDSKYNIEESGENQYDNYEAEFSRFEDY
mgnify:CR=1 FL=1